MIDNKSCNRIMFMHIYISSLYSFINGRPDKDCHGKVCSSQARSIGWEGEGGPPFLVANIFLLYLDIKHELLWSLISPQTSYEDVKNLSETK